MCSSYHFLQIDAGCYSSKRLQIDDNKNATAKLHDNDGGGYPLSVLFYILDDSVNKISYYDLFDYPNNGGYNYSDYILGFILTIALITNIIWSFFDQKNKIFNTNIINFFAYIYIKKCVYRHCSVLFNHN